MLHHITRFTLLGVLTFVGCSSDSVYRSGASNAAVAEQEYRDDLNRSLTIGMPVAEAVGVMKSKGFECDDVAGQGRYVVCKRTGGPNSLDAFAWIVTIPIVDGKVVQDVSIDVHRYPSY